MHNDKIAQRMEHEKYILGIIFKVKKLLVKYRDKTENYKVFDVQS